MKKSISIIVAILMAGFLVYGVTFHKKETPAEKPGKVAVTAAYEKFFGPAPSVDKGNAYAFVLYFPSAKEAGKLVPLPFFSFDEASLKRVAIQRLLGEMEIGSYEDEIRELPRNIRLISMNESQGTVTLDFSKELLAGTDNFQAIGNALGLTLLQFKGVARIHVLVEGKTSPLNVYAKSPDDTAVKQPSPPRLLSVTAMRDTGAKQIEEVNAFFDRPVEIKELKLLTNNGQQLAGDVYHSVFDMAAVLKPKDPAQFKERMPVKVRWKVVDKLGREAEGDNVWLLEIKQH